MSTDKAEERFSFFRGSPYGFVAATPDFVLTAANDAFCEMIACSQEEIGRINFINLTVPQDRPENLVLLEELRSGARDNFLIEKRLQSQAGSLLWVRVSVSGERDENGVLSCLYAIVENISERVAVTRQRDMLTTQLNDGLENMSDAFYLLDRDWCMTFVNGSAETLIQRPRSELLGRVIWDEFSSFLNTEMENRYRRAMMEGGADAFEFCSPASGRWFDIRLHATVEGLAVYFREISKRKQQEALSQAQARILEMLVLGEPLTALLDVVMFSVESLVPTMKASVLLVDESGKYLRHGAAPNLPEAYSQAIDGLAIGPRAGACGTAAHRHELVVVADTETDPLFQDYRELTREYGLRSCWSMPVLDANGDVLATFALYGSKPSSPDPDDIAIIRQVEHLLRIAIEHVYLSDSLRDSEEKFKLLADNIEEMFWIFDFQKACILYVSPAYERIWGFSRQALYDDPGVWLEAIHPEDRGRFQRVMLSREQGIEYRVVLANGEVRWVFDKGFLVRDEAGEVSRIVGVARDITQTKQAELAVMESEQRFRAVADATADIVWDWELEADTIWWSPGLNEVFGHDVATAYQRGSGFWIENIHPEDAQSVVDGINAVIQGSENRWSAQYRFRRHDGSFAQVMDRGYVIRDVQGTGIRMVGSISDMTHQLSLEQQLRQAQRLEAIGQLTGGIAHDFNNLLTVILGNAEILEESLSSNQKLRPLAEMARMAAERGAELTGRLLAFARRQALAPKVTDVSRLIADMDALLRRTLGDNIEIEFVRGGGLWPAFVDAGQLESAILNLCINARDAMSGGGKLTIETANVYLDQDYTRHHTELSPGQYVMVAVSDTGTGMTPETMQYAFEPFYTTKAVGKGSGLGLSMVFGFIKQSSGHIKIYSELGQGTTLKLYLPRSSSSKIAQLERVSGLEKVAGTEKILLVEDDDLVREYAQEQLKALGYQVISANNGVDALALLKEIPDFDLLFTDIVMPGGMNGPQLAAAAAQIRSGLPVLYTSGYTENAVVHHGRLDQGVELLQKPYRPQDLGRKIREVLNKSNKSDG
ncbi:MAG: PAS domain S-box protein [Pseudomonadales bacterium]|nr:PAS domain S-box protein [Pseudomonadales bacterium]